MATSKVIYLGNLIDRTKVEVAPIMGTFLRRIAEIKAVFTFPPHKFKQKQKEDLKQIMITYPVALSLHPDIKRNVAFIFNDKTIELS